MPFYIDFNEEFLREHDPHKQIISNLNLGNINENIILYTNNSKDELNTNKGANSMEASNDKAKFANISLRNNLKNTDKKFENFDFS